MALIDTIGGTDSNSYVSVAVADAYFLTTANRILWNTADSSNKEASLIEAARQIDSLFDWLGLIRDEAQALDWPRKSYDFQNVDRLYYSDLGFGYQLDRNPFQDAYIPVEVQYAQMELAYYILENGFSLQEQIVNEVKIGSIDVKLSPSIRESAVPKIVIEILKPIGEFRVSSPNSTGMIRLTRV